MGMWYDQSSMAKQRMEHLNMCEDEAVWIVALVEHPEGLAEGSLPPRYFTPVDHTRGSWVILPESLSAEGG